MIALHTQPEEVTFDSPEEFESYLRSEGLERNLALQQRRTQHGQKIRETYSLCAKSLVAAGEPDARDTDKALGLPLELVADMDQSLRPRQKTKTETAAFLQGKPLDDALVVLSNKSAPLVKLKARTDRDGRVGFGLPRRGVWLATAVHMVPAPRFAAEDWNSHWASLTFEWGRTTVHRPSPLPPQQQ